MTESAAIVHMFRCSHIWAVHVLSHLAYVLYKNVLNIPTSHLDNGAMRSHFTLREISEIKQKFCIPLKQAMR